MATFVGLAAGFLAAFGADLAGAFFGAGLEGAFFTLGETFALGLVPLEAGFAPALAFGLAGLTAFTALAGFAGFALLAGFAAGLALETVFFGAGFAAFLGCGLPAGFFCFDAGFLALVFTGLLAFLGFGFAGIT